MNSPWKLIAAFLHSFKHIKDTYVVAVVPFWPTAEWFSLLNSLTQGTPWIVPHTEDTFLHRGQRILGLPPWQYYLVVVLQGGRPRPPPLPQSFWARLGLSRAPPSLHVLGYSLVPYCTGITGPSSTTPRIPVTSTQDKSWKWLGAKKAPSLSDTVQSPRQCKSGTGKAMQSPLYSREDNTEKQLACQLVHQDGLARSDGQQMVVYTPPSLEVAKNMRESDDESPPRFAQSWMAADNALQQ
ncbi:hypothetical protein SARC_00905 [Sphaeroforma arctica JP610]|uniref:Uncharacterized protein n=1 Tax=Sphaeroforma arctica JP610 TaxID=667725 RepID=A0A0L0GDH0_9EUKA|nr:hypothetical protein SARC_00905 [Sphaeroforma arctica JP610]KNC86954.1 hypothetical protein SARC_00905 [Sphaeroforma arctica JP610]|eukprot:XP_014160856.1 hypothetical protein SARC_00905 [Sphaeroforma arctica JP610]